jgi:DNA-directed RNA polymerase subunit omega
MPVETEGIDSKFRFILIAAKRARQLQAGAKPLVHTTSRKPTRIAQEEVRSGAVKFELLPYAKKEEPAEEEAPSKKGKAAAKNG